MTHKPGSPLRITRWRRLWWRYERIEQELAWAIRGNRASRRQVVAWGCWLWLAILIPVAVVVVTIIMLTWR